MARLKIVLSIIAIFVVLLAILLILQQARGKDTLPQPNGPEPSVVRDEPPSNVEPLPRGRWWEAQRKIQTSIADLEAYLKESPPGEHAQAARQQLEVLRGLAITYMPKNWITLYNDIEWRITSVGRQPDKTRLTIQVRNTQSDGEYYFYAFDTSPLILLDSNGEYYPMLYSSPAPQGIKVVRDIYSEPRLNQWYIQGGRTISITVDFAPLGPGVASGQVQYRDNNKATPARFSLSEFGK